MREVGSTYELQGELPGLEQKDLEIEFLDERTLVIRGRTASEKVVDSAAHPEGDHAATAAVDAAAAASSDATSEKSVNYRKPSVEEEDGFVDAGAESEGGSGAKTPAESVTAAEQEKPVESQKAAAAAEPKFKYWVSERSVGEFERRFSFPGRVDQEAVKASLKNGVLSVVVPKVVAREVRRIQIE